VKQPWLFCVVFTLGVVTDGVWVLWMTVVANGFALSSAAVSMVIGAMNIFGMGQALKSKKNALALILGLGLGSYLATTLGARFH